MKYPRPVNNDFENARPGEELVAEWLGTEWSTHFDSPNDMDFTSHRMDDRGDWATWAVDVKEKMQPLSFRWKLWSRPSADTFVLDELSIRKALQYGHCGWFVLHDVPLERWFVASAVEICMGDHVRVNRTGSTGWSKGKWLIDLRQFNQYDPESQDWVSLPLMIQADTLKYQLGSPCMKGES